MNIYKSLVEKGLIDEFLMNFKVTRNIQEMNKVRVLSNSYYIDGKDRIPLNVYKYQYDVKTTYSIFGYDFVTREVVYGESICKEDVPYGKRGKFDTTYCNLTGYECSSYLFDGRKNVMSKYGKTGVFDLPFNVIDLFNDKDFCVYVYMFYSYISDRENIDIEDIYNIKRLVQITKEMNKLKNEREEILSSFEKVLQNFEA